MSDEKLSQIKVAGFVIKPNAPELFSIYQSIKEKFEARNIEVLLVDYSAQMLGSLEGIGFKEICEKSDFLVSLGGDGTLLSLVRKSYGSHKPVVGINAGT